MLERSTKLSPRSEERCVFRKEMKKIAIASGQGAGTARIISRASSGGLQSQLSACYIYGIIRTGQKIILKSRAIDLTGAKIYSIPYKDIGALVSRTKYSEYDPTEDNLLIHNDALREAYVEYKCTVLPLRFSTIAKSESDVLKILANGYSKFRQKMASLAGMVEIAVKIQCDVSALRGQVEREIRSNDNKVLEAALKKKSYELADNLFSTLKAISHQHQLNDLIFEDTIMNAAFLISEARSQEFFNEIRKFEGRHEDILEVKWSGPYVPYSFSEPPA